MNDTDLVVDIHNLINLFINSLVYIVGGELDYLDIFTRSFVYYLAYL